MKNILVTFLFLSVLLIFTGCSDIAFSSQAVFSSDQQNNNAVAASEWKWKRSVEIVCPFGSGGGTDTSLRALQPYLEKFLGVSVVINNQPGSSGLIGAEYFINQPSDGYSYLIITPSHTVHEVTGDMSFTITNDTEPVCILNEEDYVLMAPAGAPYSDILELQKAAKQKPGEITVACISMGGSDEFALNLLMKELDVSLKLVPYSSGAEQMSALLGGFVDLILSSPSESAAYIESKDMKALGILNSERNDILPSVKCDADMGIDVAFPIFRGIIAKKGIPEGALSSIRAAFERAVQDPGWKKWLVNNGLKSDCFGTYNELAKSYARMLRNVKEGMKLPVAN